MFLYALALILEFAALVWLRLKQPGMARPYRIPFGTAGTIALSFPPVALCLLSMALANNPTKLVSLAGIGLGLIVYHTMGRNQEMNQG
jgi:amino acid transporter